MADTMSGELCPFCLKKTLTLVEDEEDIPFFGKTYIFSMTCGSCGFHKGDVEAAEKKDPVELTFIIEKEDDLKVRVVKSSNATVKVPTLRMSVEPGEGSIGYVSNIEGVLNRFQEIIEMQRDATDDPSVKKSAKNLLKKMRKIKYGEIPCKIVISDPTGNSAIISERTEIKKLKKKKE